MACLLASLLITGSWFQLAAGHAYLLDPPSRNVLANRDGHETCPHCLQSGGPDAVKTRSRGVWPTRQDPESHGLCGDPVQGSPDPTSIAGETYLSPSTHTPRTYVAGDVVEFVVGLSTHHWGHYEFRLCTWELNTSLSSKQVGQACLDEHVLVRADRASSCGSETLGDCQYNNPKHPERWYLPPPGSNTQVAGSNWVDTDVQPYSANDEIHVMRYRIPADVTCDHCTLQWYYATGNTCAYDDDYLSFDPGFKFWQHYKASWATAENSVCGPSGGGKFGEEFWNCADIRIVSGGPVPPVAPTSPTPTPKPTASPIQPHTPAPMPTQHPTPYPTPSPTPYPTPSPPSLNPSPSTAGGSCRNPDCGCPPFTGGASWCTDDNSKYGEWCQKGAGNCQNCGAVWCEYPQLLTKTKGRQLRFRRSTDDVMMQVHARVPASSDSEEDKPGQPADEL